MTIAKISGLDFSLAWAIYDDATGEIIATFASIMDAGHFILFMQELSEFDSCLI